jgi:hypothetical protein
VRRLLSFGYGIALHEAIGERDPTRFLVPAASPPCRTITRKEKFLPVADGKRFVKLFDSRIKALDLSRAWAGEDRSRWEQMSDSESWLDVRSAWIGTGAHSNQRLIVMPSITRSRRGGLWLPANLVEPVDGWAAPSMVDPGVFRTIPASLTSSEEVLLLAPSEVRGLT